MEKKENVGCYILGEKTFVPKAGKIIYTKDGVRHKCYSTRGTPHKNDISCDYCSLQKYIEGGELQCLNCFDFYFKVCSLY